MNIDQAEITKFNQMANHWWDPQGPCKPLHELNPLRLNFIQSCCALGEQPILDVGCGGGILTEALSQFSPHVTGLDLAPNVLAVAQEHAKSLPTPPRYICTSVEDFAAKHPGEFSVITCMELLEHVPDPLAIIQACYKLLKPGGELFLSTINRTPKAFLYAIVGAEYVLKILPRNTHDYERFIRPSELTRWAHQFQLKALKGVSISLLSQRYTLSQDVSVNYLAHFRKEFA